MYKHTKGDLEIEDDVYRVQIGRLNPGVGSDLEAGWDRVSKAAGFEPLFGLLPRLHTILDTSSDLKLVAQGVGR